MQAERHITEDRIMPYLVKIDTARQNTSGNEEVDSEPTRKYEVNKSLNSIEQAVSKFLGGFNNLKSELSELKNTVLKPCDEEDE